LTMAAAWIMPAADEPTVLDAGNELLSTLGGYNIIVPVKVERALPFPVEADEVVPRPFGKTRNLYDPVREAQAIQFRSNALHAR
jgi:hypothetical protein